MWFCGKRQDYGPEYAFSESDGTILLGRTATVLVAVLYNKQKICHGGQILLLQRGGDQEKLIVGNRFFKSVSMIRLRLHRIYVILFPLVSGPTFRTLGTQYRATQSGDGLKHGVRQPHEVKNLLVEVAELWLEELDLTIGFE